MMKKPSYVCAAILTLALATVSQAFAAELKIFCHSNDPLQGLVTGQNVDLIYPIASVSKVMTAHWAVTSKGVGHRFQTIFHFRKSPAGTMDLHVAGSRDPYTDQVMFQFVVSQLNQSEIKKLNRISFDENFKFRRDIRNGAAKKYMENFEPGPKTVKFQLEQMLKALNADYEYTRIKASAYYGIELSKTLELTALEVSHLTSAEFAKEAKEFSNSKKYSSIPLARILKEMNRNSNNHAATQIFEAMGGAAAYKPFIAKQLKLPEDQVQKHIRFYNGSGNRLDLAPNKSVYNQASCRTMLKVQQLLNLELTRQKSGIEKVISVAGRFVPNEDPGFIEFYAGEKTEGILLAKTGTVGPAVTIGGQVMTKSGPLYFGYIAATKLSEQDWAEARETIKEKIDLMMSEILPGPKFDYVPLQFVPFDKSSLFSNQSNQKDK